MSVDRAIAAPATLEWVGGVEGHLRLIDQTLLPGEYRQIDCRTVEEVWEAIKMLRVRGAPAIGIAAAYGVVIGMQGVDGGDREAYGKRLKEVADYLRTSRPTAVNLFWAIERMERVAAEGLGARSARPQAPGDRVSPAGSPPTPTLPHKGEGGHVQATSPPRPLTASPSRPLAASPSVTQRLLEEAKRIHEEDREICRAIGRHGAKLLVEGQGVLTHCNAGGLATADYGTALAAFFAAHEQGKHVHVYVDETRPLLQGSRLTAWELKQRGIEATLICDSMAAQVMKEGKVQAVITGADRIAANGDTANKIGTYSVAVLAKAHGIPFYVAAPVSTFDLSLESGEQIPIEQRDAGEITHGFGRATAPEGVDVYNPAFDVTPAELIAAIVTERGVIRPVNRETVAAMVR